MPTDRSSRSTQRVWLFDLDNTLHDAGAWAFGAMNAAMGRYVCEVLGLDPAEADVLRTRYWRRYGSTMLGLVRHHAVRPDEFLRETHRFPELEQRVTGHRHDLAAIARLRGRKVVLTNAPRAYALRVLRALGAARLFDEVISIEDMRMFGHWRPKPDRRMFRRVAVLLGVHPVHCVLVEDALDNVRAARTIGMQTVWMQRYARRGAHSGPRELRWSQRPPGTRVVQTFRTLLNIT
ncbi:MAG TPA: pyrimidine 5'-nucleotidase [Burkholderiaceae bacterium]|nr:pyrimidine 5'-nucleotidase [Burkholderiaceae bacterium]